MTNDERERLRLAEQAVIKLEKDHAAMKQTLDSIKSDTAEMVQMFKGGKALGLALRWLVMTAAAFGTVWYMLKGR